MGRQLSLFPEYKQATSPLPQLAEINVTYSYTVPSSQLQTLSSSYDSYKLFLELWNKDTLEYYEEMIVLFLNRANRVLGFRRVSRGGISSTTVDVRIIYGIALKSAASGLILAHNHPSGAKKPSSTDVKLTEELQKAGKFFHINLLDHLIITSEGYYSMADEGWLSTF